MTIIIMGVSGCGKSTVAEALAKRTGGEFLDADPYHPAANVEKMLNGIPLTDEDRAGWLAVLAGLLKDRAESPKPVILACSALKESYRTVLRVNSGVRFVYLKGSFDLISQRIKARTGHFMKSSLLESQFKTLEEPADALTVDVGLPVEHIVDQIVKVFDLEGH